MKIQALILQAMQFLNPTSASARLDAEVIVANVLNCKREDLYIRSQENIDGVALQKCLQNIELRIQGMPVSYITNKKDFLNHTFFVQEGVLIPRPETELLVEYALHWIEKQKENANFWALDIGSGSGCIGISLLKEVYKLNVVAIDISERAIETTMKNAKDLEVADKIFVLQKDADKLSYEDFHFLKEKGFKGQFDVIISNPPYISEDDKNVEPGVRKFEPKEALFCDKNGLEKIENWTNLAGSLLCEKGLWIFEIGSNQGKAAQKIVADSGFFEDIQSAQDYSGLDRFIIATKKKVKNNN